VGNRTCRDAVVAAMKPLDKVSGRRLSMAGACVLGATVRWGDIVDAMSITEQRAILLTAHLPDDVDAEVLTHARGRLDDASV
jgi:hypothetical protein